MVKGTTKSGFEFELPKETFDNMELLDALNEMDSNPLAVSKVCDLVLGKEGKKTMYDHLRCEDGRVPIERVINEIKEIFTLYGQAGKNS